MIYPTAADFLAINAWLIFINWQVIGAALFVVVWWPAVIALRRYRGEAWVKSDGMIIAMALFGMAIMLERARRIKGHFFVGRDAIPLDGIELILLKPDFYLWIILACYLAAFSLHLIQAWERTTWPLLLMGFLGWQLIGFILWYQVGGFEFAYI